MLENYPEIRKVCGISAVILLTFAIGYVLLLGDVFGFIADLGTRFGNFMDTPVKDIRIGTLLGSIFIVCLITRK